MKNKILVIDNYDSFVYNLVHYLEEFDCDVILKKNDSITLEEVNDYHKILLSPGPGIPSEAGIMNELIKTFASTKSIFGVCLGQQAIGEVFGAKLKNLNEVFHGISTVAVQTAEDEYLFKNVSKYFEVGRYHSWVVSEEGFPEVLEVTSVAENGEIMSLRHKIYDVRGVQFHPESILTPEGKKMIENWLKAGQSRIQKLQINKTLPKQGL